MNYIRKKCRWTLGIALEDQKRCCWEGREKTDFNVNVQDNDDDDVESTQNSSEKCDGRMKIRPAFHVMCQSFFNNTRRV